MNNSPDFPALFEQSTRESHSLGGVAEFIVGRSQSANLPVLDAQVSRQQFKIMASDGQYVVVPLSVNSPTFHNSEKLAVAKALSHGSIIQAGVSVFVFVKYADSELTSNNLVQKVQHAATMVGISSIEFSADQTMMVEPDSDPSGVMLERVIPVRGDMLIGRDRDRVSICLPHSQVSRIHAQITVRDRGAIVSDLSSANGTFINGKRINASTSIVSGDHIDIGPYALTFDGKSLLPRSRVNNVELACRNLTRVVKNRETGGTMTILDEVNLVIRPREFVCLLGPSGSGKSTLLSALSARTPAEHGKVTINGEDLYTNFDALKRDIAVVPQKDVLHDSLSLESALSFTAKLRLPPDSSAKEIDASVADILRTVSLTSRAKTQVRNLSGGQLKRASLANEIVSKPSLLFLDEVTSGLDEQTDAEMMRLFRQIADGGKTVVCVTHSLAHVEQSCHRIVVLAESGKLAFVGTPAEALTYFDIQRLGEVYEKLATQSPEEWKDAFCKHEAYQRHVGQYLQADSDIKMATSVRIQPSWNDQLGVLNRQVTLLTQRYAQIQIADRRSLLMMLGQCLLVGLLIVLLFGNISEELLPQRSFSSAQIMFLMAISVFWFGCSNSAKEIVKERTIYTRERDVNQLVASYLASKVLLLGAVSLFQATLLYLVVSMGTGFESSWYHYILLSTLAVSGVTMGLLISAASETTDMAITVVPLVLIPQIIFSGAIAAVSGLAKFLACIGVVVYWAYGGLLASFPTEVAERLEYEDWSVFGAWFIITMHATAYLVAAFLVLDIAGHRDAVYGKAIDRLLTTARSTISTKSPAK